MVHSGWGSRFVPGRTQYNTMELILLLYLPWQNGQEEEIGKEFKLYFSKVRVQNYICWFKVSFDFYPMYMNYDLIFKNSQNLIMYLQMN